MACKRVDGIEVILVLSEIIPIAIGEIEWERWRKSSEAMLVQVV
jgi:hypothetical protein